MENKITFDWKAESQRFDGVANLYDTYRPSYFKKVVVRKYPWSARYKTDEYLGLLNTYSDHLSFSEQKRGVLFEDIAEVIEKNGGFIERPYLSVLIPSSY